MKKCKISDEELLRLYNDNVDMKTLEELSGISRQAIFNKVKKYQEATRRDGSKGELVPMVCPKCGEPFTRPKRNTIDKLNYCSIECFHSDRALNVKPEIKYSVREYRRRSRLVYELNVRQLTEGEVIHHIDGDITNYSLENLMVFPNHSAHMRFHHSLRKG